MSAFKPEWDNSKCVCVHWDARECAKIRDGARGNEDWLTRHCECCCHDNVEDYDDDCFDP